MWAPIGQQARVPITGEHARRILTGVMNIRTGDYLDYVSTQLRQEQFQEILRQVRRHWRGWQIILFVDRNTPHKAQASRRLARELNIQLRWLPKACSELNVMERLWKFVKKQCLYSKYYADFTTFKGAIATYLNETHAKHKCALDSLITLRFQTFKKAQLVPV